MIEIATERSEGEPDIRRLTFDMDVEVCVVGAGLAGLCVALEAAKLGARVAVLESRRIGWGASGWHLGTVKPGFDVSPEIVIARIGRRAAGELWRMSQTGAEIVRVRASQMPDVALVDGALEVSASARGDRALQESLALGADFAIQAEPWDRTRVREVLDTKRYFSALHDPAAFQIDSQAYLRGLAAAARQAGIKIFEDTPVTEIDVSGNRKRIVTPIARMRASHVVLAGNVHLGKVLPRLAGTLLPVWRYGAITAPLGERLVDAIDFGGSVADSDGIDQFRSLGEGRLMWSSPETTWKGRPQNFARMIQRRIRNVFPGLGRVAIAETFGGAIGQTVHGMPQIGQLRPGLWVASGFGRKGLNTTAMAGRVIARGIVFNDDRWRMFNPFDLIWAGGRTGLVAGFAIEQASRCRAAAWSALARRREASMIQAERRAARLAAVSRNNPVAAKAEPARPDLISEAVYGPPRPASARDALPPSPFLNAPQSPDTIDAAERVRSQESERLSATQT